MSGRRCMWNSGSSARWRWSSRTARSRSAAGKQRSLLALLLLHANEVVSTERLIDELWGESPPATVNKSVQVYVSRLRKQLGDGRSVTRAPGYVLRLDPDESDLGRFERLLAGAAADPATASEKLREALALWRGPPLADLAYEPLRPSGDRTARGAAAGRARTANRSRSRRRSPRTSSSASSRRLVREHPLASACAVS